ncbi:MAG: type II secretion system F family protein [Bacteroidota bacterium]
MELLITIIVGIIIAVVIFLLLSSNEEDMDKNLKTRLDKIKNKTFESEKREQTKITPNIQILFKDTEYKIAFVSNLLEKLNLTNAIKKQLKAADVSLSVDTFFLIILLIPIPFLIISLFITSYSFIIIPVGFLFAFFPFGVLSNKKKQRLDLFSKQFPDALGLVSSSLRAGHSLHSSFGVVSDEMPYPINGIFKTVVDDISLGRDTRDAINGMILSMPDSLDLKFFATAVLIQREIGGNLAEILDSLSSTIRERFKLLGQLKAQTALAKMSGTILSFTPVLIGTVLWFMNPKYMEPLFTEPIGKMALAGSFFAGLMGYFIIMKITAIKV